MRLIILILILLSANFLAQKSLEKKIHKTIKNVEKRNDAKYSEYGIDDSLWTENISTLKKGDTITYYTTSNLSACHLKTLSFFKSKHISIQESKSCIEPSTMSVSKVFYS